MEIGIKHTCACVLLTTKHNITKYNINCTSKSYPPYILANSIQAELPPAKESCTSTINYRCTFEDGSQSFELRFTLMIDD